MKISLELAEILQVIQLFIGPIFQAIVDEEVFGEWNNQMLVFE
jgi:hypothetical protein